MPGETQLPGTPDAGPRATPVRLSICMATYGRAAYIGQTLESILPQAVAAAGAVEVVVVDGASPDETPAVVGAFLAAYPCLRYRRQTVNAGVDRDFDTAVTCARGEYCWLMSDDDLLVPDAVARVLSLLADEPELLVVNAQMRDKDLAVVLKPSQMPISGDVELGPGESERLLVLAGSYLSFIGSVVIRRDAWMARAREPYFGSMFIHVGVIFQPPALGRARLVAEPLVHIRYGNASWSARTHEIWTSLWPRLVWSFGQFSDQARQQVTPRYPSASLRVLLWHRGAGSYGPAQRRALVTDPEQRAHWLAGLVARLPARAVNALLAVYTLITWHRDGPMRLYHLACAHCSTAFTRWLTQRLVLPKGQP